MKKDDNFWAFIKGFIIGECIIKFFEILFSGKPKKK